VRWANPAIHIDSTGVMITLATPAFQVFSSLFFSALARLDKMTREKMSTEEKKYFMIGFLIKL
jgi:hypothetical protein